MNHDQGDEIQSNDEIKVRAQDTPNPSALRFILNRAMIMHGNATYTEKEQAEWMKLVESLFDLPGVEQVYLFENTLTITHEGRIANHEMKELVTSVLLTRYAVHNPNIKAPEDSGAAKREPVDRSKLSKEIQEIEGILDRTIRPGLQADGGDLEVLSFKNNELQVLYMGACGGCPSSTMGTLDAIQNILRYELDNPEIIVYPV